MPCSLTCITVALAVITIVCAAIAWHRGDGALTAAMQSSLSFLGRTLPLFVIGIVLAGLLSVLVPVEVPAESHVVPRSINISTLIFIALVAICMIIAYHRDDGTLTQGLHETWKMFRDIWVLLVVAWIFAGYIGVLLPEQFVAQWLGRGSGFKGIAIACVAGGLTPGGPFISLPIVAMLYRAGAGEGVIVAYLSAWSLYAVGRLPFEISFIGVRLTAIRFASVLIFPPLAGIVAKMFFEKGP
jgi:uncharacterized membrane protein YraQ (UPF0718 family)